MKASPPGLRLPRSTSVEFPGTGWSTEGSLSLKWTVMYWPEAGCASRIS